MAYSTPIATRNPEQAMFTIEVTVNTNNITYRVNNGARRQCGTFDIMAWRQKLPGCTIYINGVLNTYGA